MWTSRRYFGFECCAGGNIKGAWHYPSRELFNGDDDDDDDGYESQVARRLVSIVEKAARAGASRIVYHCMQVVMACSCGAVAFLRSRVTTRVIVFSFAVLVSRAKSVAPELPEKLRGSCRRRSPPTPVASLIHFPRCTSFRLGFPDGSLALEGGTKASTTLTPTSGAEEEEKGIQSIRSIDQSSSSTMDLSAGAEAEEGDCHASVAPPAVCFAVLPAEVLLDIVSRLDAASMCALCLSSKAVSELIQDDYFWRAVCLREGWNDIRRPWRSWKDVCFGECRSRCVECHTRTRYFHRLLSRRVCEQCEGLPKYALITGKSRVTDRGAHDGGS